MEYVSTALALLAVAAFGYFIYKKVTAKKPPSSGTGGGGFNGDSNTQLK
jgi:hypothetical protein